jgi:uncharacterized Tic20 family protein
MEIIDEQTGINIPTNEERNSAMFTHLASFGSLIVPFGNIIGPLIVWLIKKDQSEFVDENGKESLNFQITYTLIILALLGLGAFFAITSGINDNEGGIAVSIVLAVILLAFVWLTGLIFVIVAAVKANNGEVYHYPVSIRFIS